MEANNQSKRGNEQEQAATEPAQEGVENNNQAGDCTLSELLAAYRRSTADERPPAPGFGPRRER